MGLCQQQLSWHIPGSSAGSDDNWKSSTVTLTPASLLSPPPPIRVVDGIEDNGHTFHFNVEHSGPKASTGGSTQGKPNRHQLGGSPGCQMAGGTLKSSNRGYSNADLPPSGEIWERRGMKWQPGVPRVREHVGGQHGSKQGTDHLIRAFTEHIRMNTQFSWGPTNLLTYYFTLLYLTSALAPEMHVFGGFVWLWPSYSAS